MASSGDSFLSPHRRALLIGAGAAAITATVTACDRTQAPIDEDGRVRLRFATDGPAQATHGGFYQALASGAYEKRGLTVQIIQGEPGGDVPQRLANTSVELGLASSSFLPMNLVAQGAPVKAVAAFFQKDPQVLIARPEPAVEGIAGLVGRPLYLSDNARDTVWLWLRATYGFTDDQLQRLEGGDLAPFLADREAVLQGELTRDVAAVQSAARFEPRVLMLADEGYPSYGAMVLSTDAFARDNAEALRGFIAASVEGWRDYIQGDGRAADTLIRQTNPDMTQADLDQARAALRSNSVVSGGDAALYGLGAMTPERWQAFFEVMSQAGLYPGDVDWRRAFTTDYLPGRG
ncbi:ABC transporter substrate-binding protein [Brevundimonas sp.]|uniref:ABC transporter substrate-binding protein n=1 Tax=Brevundimonas sp. TaxID=1871086 RepID=UPI0035B0E170